MPSSGHVSQRIPALDGLRAAAVLLVIAHHWDVEALRGGRLGVDVFFVLSGFLITNLLVADAEHGRFEWKRFYVNRGFRLVPALLLLVVVMGLVVGFTRYLDEIAGKILTNSVAAVVYLHNWFIIRAPSQFTWVTNHFWSLAIEEQFYLVWPVALVLGWRALGRRGVLLAAIGVGLMSLCLAITYTVMGKGDWFYYRTDARAYQLMLGAVLAIIPSLDRQRFSRAMPPRLVAISAVALLALALWLDHPVGFSYRTLVAHVLVAAVTVVVIAQIHLGLGPLSRVLAFAPLVWLGQISYGIYLWHLPIGSFVGRDVGWNWGFNAGTWALCAALTLLAASASYYLLERPSRHWARARVDSQTRTAEA